MATKDGGYAFPVPETSGHGPSFGMSLRDYFAANEQSTPPRAWLKAHYRTQDIDESGVVKHEALSKWRYEMADAMLAAREATNGNS